MTFQLGLGLNHQGRSRCGEMKDGDGAIIRLIGDGQRHDIDHLINALFIIWTTMADVFCYSVHALFVEIRNGCLRR